MLDHLREEEVSATQVVKKYYSKERQFEIVRSIWDHFSYDEHRVLFNFVLSNLRMREMRIKFVKGFAWAMPERTEELGLMIHREVSDVTWCELSERIEGLAPRGLRGYKRFY